MRTRLLGSLSVLTAGAASIIVLTGFGPVTSAPPAATRVADTLTHAGVAQESTPQLLSATTLRTYDTFDADQGVAVDRRYFYSVDNYSITKHDRRTGKALLQWYGGANGPIVHLDGAAVLGGRLYAPHSNYPTYPETSSVEVWDPRTMRHVASHSFGIDRGSLTWFDRHNGYWWATFANYDKIQQGQTEPYGQTDNTQLVKLNDRFDVVASWIFPTDLVDQFRPMSNSGGSWGPDGRLYITGHDDPDIYVLELPAAGSVVQWVATISAPDIAGQGIVWDRSSAHPTLWGISREGRKVVQMSVPLQPGRPQPQVVGSVYGPGHFIETGD